MTGRFGPALDDDPGWINRKFADYERRLVEQASARRLTFASTWRQPSQIGFDLTDTWAEYCRVTISKPDGFTKGLVQITCSTRAVVAGGLSQDIDGLVGVRPYVDGMLGIYNEQGRLGGGVVSVTAATVLSVDLTSRDAFDVWLEAFGASQGGFVADSGTVMLSAGVTFTRE